MDKDYFKRKDSCHSFCGEKIGELLVKNADADATSKGVLKRI